jgi:cystathionine beta-lyase
MGRRVQRYDFDRLIERRGTSSLKWDFNSRFAGSAAQDLIPLWVADMDFPAPVEVVEALRRRVEHGVYGYTLEPESYFRAVIGWLQRRHGWRVRRPWLLPGPGVIPALDLAIMAYSQPGDEVVIQPPVYYPFRQSILAGGRRVLENPLKLTPEGYVMDFEGLERALGPRTRLLVLCSPHNPVARVWRREELERLLGICSERQLIILSDEIHHDLVLPGHSHIPAASLSPEAARITITFTSATKTFNLAGLGGGLTIIPDRLLRDRFQAAQERMWSPIANAFSLAAAEAAYRFGEEWLEQVLRYVAGNYALLVSLLREGLPSAQVLPLEGTYLAWVNMRPLGHGDAELKRRILEEARVWLDDGPMFGTGGEGFQRINLACPRALLEQALERMMGALRA